MALYNSAYAVVLPFIFLFTIPIALFASLTTFIAFSILLVRVTVVYVELALAIIPHYLFGTSIKSNFTPNHEAVRTTAAVPRRKKRRTSSSSNLSAGSVTPTAGENLLGLSQSIGPTRDFEGVGGWRLVESSTSDDEGLWTNINSRLELPADHGRRHHHRSLTSGSMPGELRAMRSYSPETMMNSSRVRTPPSSAAATNGLGGEYFPSMANTSRGLRRESSGATGMTFNSGSSGSSKASSVVLQMKQR